MSNKIIVCQTGSRHRYLIPKVFEKAGLLSRLYTDTTTHSKVGRIAKLCQNIGLDSKVIRRLEKRNPDIPQDKLYTTDTLFYKDKLLSFLPHSYEKRLFLLYNGFERQCIKWGVGDADCVYSMYFENMEFLRYAKSKGLKVVVDIYETPSTYINLLREIDDNPEYAQYASLRKTYEIKHKIRMHYIEDMLALADYYTVPSKFVIKSLYEFKNFDEKKVLFQPYASSVTTAVYNYRPQKHKVIFVGNETVRKGVLYCAKAATILKQKYPDLQFLMIGSDMDDLRDNPAFNDVTFTGVVDKARLIEEYSTAEAYVFPTLYEGFAGTIIEAASCGCPIITTESSGADPDEFPAIYIPMRDVDAIVGAVSKIFDNSQYRDDLSLKTYEYAKKLSPESYSNSLIQYFKKI